MYNICGLVLIVLEGSGACFLLSGVRLSKNVFFLTRFIDSVKTGCCKLPWFLNVNCFTVQPDSETQHIQNKSKNQVVTALFFLCIPFYSKAIWGFGLFVAGFWCSGSVHAAVQSQ